MNQKNATVQKAYDLIKAIEDGRPIGEITQLLRLTTLHDIDTASPYHPGYRGYFYCLTRACADLRPDVVKLLIDHKANPNVTTPYVINMFSRRVS